VESSWTLGIMAEVEMQSSWTPMDSKWSPWNVWGSVKSSHSTKIIQFQSPYQLITPLNWTSSIVIDDVHTCVDEVECKQVQKQADE